MGAFENLQCLPSHLWCSWSWAVWLRKQAGMSKAHSNSRLVAPCVSFLILQRGPPPRTGPGVDRRRQCNKPPWPPLVPAPRLPTSCIFRLITGIPWSPSVHISWTMLHTLGLFLLPLCTSVSVIHCCVTSYPRLNGIKQPPFFSSVPMFHRSGI